jgi:hypothetical protein
MLFGTIVHWFARYEVLMQQIIATVIGSHLADVMLLTKTLTLGEKRIALLNLLRHRVIPLDQFDAVYKYLTIPETFSLLVSDIKHSAWVAGRLSSSIQPGCEHKIKTASPHTGSCAACGGQNRTAN